MWISTNEKFENSPMFFKFLKKNDTCFFNFTNLKKYFLKEIHESMFSSIFSVSHAHICVLFNLYVYQLNCL